MLPEARRGACRRAAALRRSRRKADAQADPGERGGLPRRGRRGGQLLRRLPDLAVDRDPQRRLRLGGRAPRVPLPPGRGRDRQRQRDHRRQPGRGEVLHRHQRPGLQPDAGGGRLRPEGGRAVRLRGRAAGRAGDRDADHARPGRHHAGALRQHRRLLPIAFYPNGVEEAFRVTIEAFNAAEESLSPVVVLSDTFVGAPQRGGRPRRGGGRDQGRAPHARPARQARARQAALLRRRADVRARPERRRAGHRRCRRVPAPVLRREASAPRGGATLRPLRARLERGRQGADHLLRDRQPRRVAAGRRLRPLPADPDPPAAGRRAARHRGSLRADRVHRGATTASTPTWSSWRCAAR